MYDNMTLAELRSYAESLLKQSRNLQPMPPPPEHQVQDWLLTTYQSVQNEITRRLSGHS